MHVPRKGNPLIQVRVPKLLYRNVRMCAKLYKAPMPVFVRDMVRAICNNEPGFGMDFQNRLARGIIAHRQQELALDNGALVLGRPGQTAKKGYAAL